MNENIAVFQLLGAGAWMRNPSDEFGFTEEAEGT
jgi:hypothetical protein